MLLVIYSIFSGASERPYLVSPHSVTCDRCEGLIYFHHIPDCYDHHAHLTILIMALKYPS